MPKWIDERVEQDLVVMMSLLKTEKEVQAILEVLLTEREIFFIASRLRAALLLFEGFNTLEVRKLSTRSPNISRGVIHRVRQSVFLRGNGKRFRPFYERFKRSRLDETD